MASGLDWDEGHGHDPSGGQSDMIRVETATRDQLAYAAQRPYREAAGSVFNYPSGDAMLLAGVIEQATGTSVRDYARDTLFAPLGIDRFEWWEDGVGHTLTHCCIDTTSRDFARFGLLDLRGGLWGDRQVVPA